MVAMIVGNGWDRRLAEQRAEVRAKVVIDARPDQFNEVEAVKVVEYAQELVAAADWLSHGTRHTSAYAWPQND
jgi:hypothetical protein